MKPRARKESVKTLNETVAMIWYRQQTRGARYVRIVNQPKQCAVCQRTPVNTIVVIASRVFGACQNCGDEIETQFVKDCIDKDKTK